MAKEDVYFPNTTQDALFNVIRSVTERVPQPLIPMGSYYLQRASWRCYAFSMASSYSLLILGSTLDHGVCIAGTNILSRRSSSTLAGVISHQKDDYILSPS